MKLIYVILLSFLCSSLAGQTFTEEIDKDLHTAFVVINDSSKGFDEDAIRRHAIQNGVHGVELFNYMQQRRRDFIYQKYFKPGRPSFYLPQDFEPAYNHSNGKPIGSGAQVMVAPCVNEGFENTTPGSYIGAVNAYAVQGWTLYGSNAAASSYNCASLGTPYTLGANEFNIVTTPLNFNSTTNCSFVLGNSPLGGNNVAQLNTTATWNSSRNKIATTFPVTPANALFQFAFAGFWENGNHSCCDQPGLYLRVLNACSGNTVASCSSMTLAPNCGTLANVSFTQCGSGVMSNWQTRSVDLTPYIGGCVTIEVWTVDCNFGGHYGTTFFDAACGGQNISPGLGGLPGGPIPGAVSFCSGSGVAQISAPQGYNFYQWVGPGGLIPPPMGTMSSITVTNPVPGTSYTVNLTSSGGCQLSSISTLNTTTVMIAGIGSSTTCPNGSSGSATVQGSGSGTGYTYTWTNTSNSVVGSSSIAVNLPSGIYSVSISGLGNAMCGTASATVAVGVGTPQTQYLFKPYCNGQAYLNTNGGTNFQWYLGNAPIQGSLGTASGYTVVSPSSGQIYNLTYVNAQNCLSQISYTLIPSAPGSVSTTASSVCLNSTNGTATISLTPANGAPPGANSYSVVNANANTPVYNSSVYPTAANVYTIAGLAAGVYSVQTFDGSCMYNNLLYVNTYLNNPTISPVSMTPCTQPFAASITWSVPPQPGQFTFNWQPNLYLIGNFNLSQNVLIQPNVPPGTNTIITYTCTITPTVINCPITRTMSINMVNPATPTFVPIPNLCTNANSYSIQVTPSGGTFSIPNGVIVPTSTALSIGTNTFTYSYSVNGCGASNSGTFELSQFNPATLTSTVAPLCVTANTVNLMNIVQSTVGVWSGTNVVNGIFNPAFLPTNSYAFTYSTQSYPNPTVCPASSNLIISVTNTLLPSIVVNPEFCTNSSTFQVVANPGGGVWANPAVTQNGIVTPSLATLQNTLASYTVNVGPCVNTNTFALRPSIYRSAALTGTIGHLCVTSSAVNLMNIVQNTVGVWSGINVINTGFNPSGLPTNTYVLTYSTQSTPNPSLCPESKTIAVSVLNPPVPNISNVGPVCSKDAAVQLTVAPNTGSWVTSSFLNSAGIFNPQTAAVGNNNVQYVIGTPTCFAQQTKPISVEMWISSAISQAIPDQCNSNSPVNLTPFTANQGLWSGAGIVGSMFIPNSVGAGSFVLTHSTATSPSGLCPNSSTTSVRVYSLQTPTITKINSMCNSSIPIQLAVSPVGGVFGGVNTNGVNLKGVFNPALGVIGKNIISYSISSGPCIAFAQTTVEVENFVSANLATYPKDYYCIGADQPFNLNSLVLNPGGSWFGPGVVGTMFDPKKANVGVNVLVYNTHSVPTLTLCPDSKTLTLKTAMIPTVSLTLNNNRGCAPLPVLLNSNQANGMGVWKFGDDTEERSLYTLKTFTAPGSYTVNFSYVSAEGCAAQTQSTAVIEVLPKPKPDFSMPAQVYISNPEIQTVNRTPNLGNHTYTWTVSNGVKDHPVNLFFIPDRIGKYEVTLTVESVNGCTATVSKMVEVKNDFEVYIPNAFTPNEDGLNDTFKPVFSEYGINSACYRLEIFDRWGQMLFSSLEQAKGWDGSVKGELCKEGSYVWKIRYCSLDGRVFDRIGYVILLRK